MHHFLAYIMGFDFVNGISPKAAAIGTLATAEGTASLTYTTLNILSSGSYGKSGSILEFKNGLLVTKTIGAHPTNILGVA